MHLPRTSLWMSWSPAGLAVHHFDLYRLTGPADMARLNMDESFRQAISLVEWAERLQQAKPADRLDMSISILSEVGSDAAVMYQH